jgi:hypothetical protein
MYLLLLSLSAHAGDVGIGFALGSPTGLTLKWYTTRSQALDLLVGEMWHDGWDAHGVTFSADYLFDLGTFAKGSVARADFYLGPGVNVWAWGGYYDHWHDHWGYSYFAVEMPIGASVMFNRAPVEIFFELAPMLVVADYPWFGMGGSLGLRFYP